MKPVSDGFQTMSLTHQMQTVPLDGFPETEPTLRAIIDGTAMNVAEAHDFLDNIEDKLFGGGVPEESKPLHAPAGIMVQAKVTGDATHALINRLRIIALRLSN